MFIIIQIIILRMQFNKNSQVDKVAIFFKPVFTLIICTIFYFNNNTILCGEIQVYTKMMYKRRVSSDWNTFLFWRNFWNADSNSVTLYFMSHTFLNTKRQFKYYLIVNRGHFYHFCKSFHIPQSPLNIFIIVVNKNSILNRVKRPVFLTEQMIY